MLNRMNRRSLALWVSLLAALGLMAGGVTQTAYAAAPPASSAKALPMPKLPSAADEANVRANIAAQQGNGHAGYELPGPVSHLVPGSDVIPVGPLAKKNTACPSFCYIHSGADLTITSTIGAGAQGLQTTTTAPTSLQVLPVDAQPLYELWAIQPGGHQGVGMTWRVDPASYGGSTAPHLAFESIKNDVYSGWNSGFSSSGGTWIPGRTITGTHSFGLIHYTAAQCGCTAGWWSMVDGSFAGVWPDTIWTASPSVSFTTMGYSQTYGEVTLGGNPSQTDMGSATYATATQGSRVTFDGYYTPPAGSPSGWQGQLLDDAERYPSVFESGANQAFRFGGPGGNLTYTGASPPADNASGVGSGSAPGGNGVFATYNDTSGGLAHTKVTETDGTASTSVCRANLGSSDGVYTTVIRTTVNTRLQTVQWFRDASCAGASIVLPYGKYNLPVGWTTLAHASAKLNATLAPCASGWPNSVPTCTP